MGVLTCPDIESRTPAVSMSGVVSGDAQCLSGLSVSLVRKAVWTITGHQTDSRSLSVRCSFEGGKAQVACACLARVRASQRPANGNRAAISAPETSRQREVLSVRYPFSYSQVHLGVSVDPPSKTGDHFRYRHFRNADPCEVRR
jgi:hypothetical protein